MAVPRTGPITHSRAIRNVLIYLMIWVKVESDSQVSRCLLRNVFDEMFWRQNSTSFRSSENFARRFAHLRISSSFYKKKKKVFILIKSISYQARRSAHVPFFTFKASFLFFFGFFFFSFPPPRSPNILLRHHFLLGWNMAYKCDVANWLTGRALLTSTKASLCDLLFKHVGEAAACIQFGQPSVDELQP